MKLHDALSQSKCFVAQAQNGSTTIIASVGMSVAYPVVPGQLHIAQECWEVEKRKVLASADALDWEPAEPMEVPERDVLK